MRRLVNNEAVVQLETDLAYFRKACVCYNRTYSCERKLVLPLAEPQVPKVMDYRAFISDTQRGVRKSLYCSCVPIGVYQPS